MSRTELLIRDMPWPLGSLIIVHAGIEMGEGSTNDLFRLDLSSGTWCEVPAKGTPPEARSFHAMTAVKNKLFVFGGCGKSGRLSDLHSFDCESETWEQLPSSNAIKVGCPCIIDRNSDRSCSLHSRWSPYQARECCAETAGVWESDAGITVLYRGKSGIHSHLCRVLTSSSDARLHTLCKGKKEGTLTNLSSDLNAYLLHRGEEAQAWQHSPLEKPYL